MPWNYPYDQGRPRGSGLPVHSAKRRVFGQGTLLRMDGQIINAYRTEDAEIFGNMIRIQDGCHRPF